MADSSYNGWTNYETWTWKLWIDNDQGWAENCAEMAADALANAEPCSIFTAAENAAIALADDLKAESESMAEDFMASQSGPFADLLNASLRSINWHEIAKSMIDDL